MNVQLELFDTAEQLRELGVAKLRELKLAMDRTRTLREEYLVLCDRLGEVLHHE